MLLITLAVLSQEAEMLTVSGDKITGKLEQVTIETTSLGRIEIKGSQIHSIWLAIFRPPEGKDAEKKVEALVKKLGDDDPEVRERSTTALKSLGPSMLPLIEKHKDSPDTEIRDRITLIIAFLKDAKGRRIDTVAGDGFVLNGFIRQLVLGSKQYDVADLTKIKIDRKSPKKNGPLFTLTDSSRISGELENSEIELVTEYGNLKIAIKDIKSILVSRNEATIITSSKRITGEIREKLKVNTAIGNLSIGCGQMISFVAKGTLSVGSIEGKWNGTAKTVEGPGAGTDVKIVVEFKQDGDTVTGTIKNPEYEKMVVHIKGTLDGENLQGDATYKLSDGMPDKYSLKIRGTFVDNSFEGEFEYSTTYGDSTLVGKAKLKLEKVLE
jgi:hypothetical protein